MKVEIVEISGDVHEQIQLTVKRRKEIIIVSVLAKYGLIANIGYLKLNPTTLNPSLTDNQSGLIITQSKFVNETVEFRKQEGSNVTKSGCRVGTCSYDYINFGLDLIIYYI
jgi:hypothetical protein